MKYHNNATLIGIAGGHSPMAVGSYYPTPQHQYLHAGAAWGAPDLPTVGRQFMYPNPPVPFLGLDLLGMSVGGPNHISYGGASMAAYR